MLDETQYQRRCRGILVLLYTIGINVFKNLVMFMKMRIFFALGMPLFENNFIYILSSRYNYIYFRKLIFILFIIAK